MIDVMNRVRTDIWDDAADCVWDCVSIHVRATVMSRTHPSWIGWRHMIDDRLRDAVHEIS